MTKRHLIIATRESPLALQQAEWIKNRLQFHHSHLSVELLGITTEADKKLTTSLRQIGGKGLFVKELEEALFHHRADIAVHSMKDVPMELPPGLCIPVICDREEARDVFVSNHYASIAALPSGALLGTASLRRQAQIRCLRPDIAIEDLRGNINTRLRRLDEGDFAGLILAAAGLKRMGFIKRIRDYLTLEQSLPAAGQGALGIECREQDKAVHDLILPLNHASTFAAVSAERAACRCLNGGCQIPVAAYAEIQHDILTLRGLVANRDGTKILRSHHSDHLKNAERIGLTVAEKLLAQGAAHILKEFY